MRRGLNMWLVGAAKYSGLIVIVSLQKLSFRKSYLNATVETYPTRIHHGNKAHSGAILGIPVSDGTLVDVGAWQTFSEG